MPSSTASTIVVPDNFEVRVCTAIIQVKAQGKQQARCLGGPACKSRPAQLLLAADLGQGCCLAASALEVTISCAAGWWS